MRFSLFRKKKSKNLFTLAFYNLENLFDAEDNDHTLDEDFTPEGFKKWTPKRYLHKLGKLSKTIFEIGKDSNTHPPVLIGVAEAENKSVLQDLIKNEPLAGIPYDFVHYESPDERGIDTALIFHRKYFTILNAEPLPLIIKNLDGARDTTRDILYVHGTLNGEEIHVFVNHWPSRRDGSDSTEYKRIIAADVILEKIADIEANTISPNFIVMGDFNDDPHSSWSLFDQIIISHNFFNYQKGSHSFDKANIYDDASLKEYKGKYKGSPFRTYAGSKYLGGYSDHFPVYIILKYNK